MIRCRARNRLIGFVVCPTAFDAVPAIETIAITSPEPTGPFRARGIGEITMIPVVPVITAAIRAVTGVWIDAIPALPARILVALAADRRKRR